MKSVQAWLDHYGESHLNPTNKLIHWVCIPAIMVSLVGLLLAIPLSFGPGWVNPASILLALACAYYWKLSVRLALGMVVVSAACYSLALGISSLPLPLWVSSLVIFTIAWVFQFIGHKIEGKKPSFFEDLQFLLIGPMWLLSAIYRRVGLSY